MNIKKIESLYNEVPYHIKESAGFPSVYLYLTNEQESFIIAMLENEISPIKKELLECINEMKDLIDEI